MTALETGLRELVLRLVREDSELRKELAGLLQPGELRKVAGLLQPDAEQLLTIALAADHANVTRRTIGRWIKEGRLPTVGAGRTVRVRVTDLETALGEPRQGDRVDPENAGRQFARGLMAAPPPGAQTRARS